MTGEILDAYTSPERHIQYVTLFIVIDETYVIMIVRVMPHGT